MRRSRSMLILVLVSIAQNWILRAAVPEIRGLRPAILDVLRWVRSNEVPQPQGSAWPANPSDPSTLRPSLYSGTPGVVIFLLVAYRETRDPEVLAAARANYLLATLNEQTDPGLYTGLSGVAFALHETYKATGVRAYQNGTQRALSRITQLARTDDSGADWNGTSDIIAGSAGVGLFLLYAAREMDSRSARELAVLAGQRLVKGGLKWRMNPGFPRLMPNFSHGTAGVSYFLATLYQDTHRREFLDAALAGARYLRSIAITTGDGCLIFHNEPDGKDLNYLGWCHGPVGTARLFFRLWQTTGEREWYEWVHKAARAILRSGIPENKTPGFWNNVGVCCGSAGVAEFFLRLYRLTLRPEYLELCNRLTADLMQRATTDPAGMRWVHAENRIEPDKVLAQTGLMQGASGIGLWLLQLNAFQNNKRLAIVFPDSPF